LDLQIPALVFGDNNTKLDGTAQSAIGLINTAGEAVKNIKVSISLWKLNSSILEGRKIISLGDLAQMTEGVPFNDVTSFSFADLSSGSVGATTGVAKATTFAQAIRIAGPVLGALTVVLESK
jgi:hypothetical protein